MKYIGVDGCKSGWFVVGIDDDGDFEVEIIPGFSAIQRWLDSAALVLVDIPIGLLSAGTTERQCDLDARQMIRPRGSTVFPAPARSAIFEDTYEAASAENYRCLGRKLSKQSFQICSKIREVDEFLREVRPGSKIREFHPEVALCGLNGMSPVLTRKKDRDGYRQRLDLLRSLYSQAVKVYAAARQTALKKHLADDDILDALAGAVTASNFPKLETLPASPPRDDEGLPMEMVFSLSSAVAE